MSPLLTKDQVVIGTILVSLNMSSIFENKDKVLLYITIYRR
jgi:hypothetical protein